MSDVKAGGAFIEFGAKFGPLEKGLRQISLKMDKFGGQVKNTGLKVGAIGGAIAAPFAAGILALSKYGDGVAKAARRTGQTTEFISGLGLAANLAGTDAQTLERGLRNVTKGLADAEEGIGPLYDGLLALGIPVAEFKALNPEDQFFTLVDAIREVKDPIQQAAIAMDVFGTKAGPSLVPLLQSGSAAIRQVIKDGRELGIVLDSETSAKAERVTDAMERVKKGLLGMSIIIGSSIEPAVSKVADTITNLIKVGVAWVKNNEETIQTVAMVGLAVGALGGTLVFLGGAAQVAAFAIGGLSKVVAFLGVVSTGAVKSFALLLTGFKLIGAGIAAVIAAVGAPFALLIGTIVGGFALALTVFDDFRKFIVDFLGFIGGKIDDFFGGFFSSIGEKLSAIQQFFSGLFSLDLGNGLSSVMDDVNKSLQEMRDNAANAKDAIDGITDANKEIKIKLTVDQQELVNQLEKEFDIAKKEDDKSALLGQIEKQGFADLDKLKQLFAEGLISKKDIAESLATYRDGLEEVKRDEPRIESSESVRGTFSGRAAQAMFGGGDFSSMEKQQMATNELLREGNRLARMGVVAVAGA